MAAPAPLAKKMHLDADIARRRYEFLSEEITAELRMRQGDPSSAPLRLDTKFEVVLAPSRRSSAMSAANAGALAAAAGGPAVAAAIGKPGTGVGTPNETMAVVDKTADPSGAAVRFRLITTQAMTATDLRTYIVRGSEERSTKITLRVIGQYDPGVGAAVAAAGMGPLSAAAGAGVRGQAAAIAAQHRPAVPEVEADVSLLFKPTSRELVCWVVARVLAHMKARGMFVGNSGMAAQVWNLGMDKTVRRARGTANLDVWCQECSEIGKQVGGPILRDLLGSDDFVLVTVHTERPGLVGDANHVANLLVMPDGERFVLDLWMSLLLDRPMYFDSLDRWLRNSEERVWDLKGYRKQMTVVYPTEMDLVRTAVATHGHTAGAAQILNAPTGRADPADHAALQRRRALLLRSYQRSPW